MRTAHDITDNTLVKAGHRLMCALFATYDFPVFYRDDDPDPLDTFRQFEDEDISKNLLTLSAIARACDDELGTLTAIEPNFPNGVGWLKEEGKDEEPLSIREACNKIIHAKRVKYDFVWEGMRIVYGENGIETVVLE